MLTGRQVRDCRRLLRWSREEFSRRAYVPATLIAAVESQDGEAWLSEEQETAMRSALEAAGVEFSPENGGGAGVRLKKVVE